MNSNKIDSLAAGRELDILVAEEVMGWKDGEEEFCNSGWLKPNDSEIQPWVWSGWLTHNASDSNDFTVAYVGKEIWNPSTSIAAAWEVVEKMMETCDNETLEFHKNDDRTWELWSYSICQWIWGESPAHAICLAALKAAEKSNNPQYHHCNDRL